MNIRPWAEKQISTVSSFLAEDEKALAQNKNDFGLRLIAKNKRQHIESLRSVISIEDINSNEKKAA